MTDAEIDKLMKRCKVGFGGLGALEQANDCLADCYRALGQLKAERANIKRALIWLEELYEHDGTRMPHRPTWLDHALSVVRKGRE